MRDDDFDVSLELPAEGTLGALLHIQLRVTNRSGALQALPNPNPSPSPSPNPCFLERRYLRRTSFYLPTYRPWRYPHGATTYRRMARPSTAPSP